MNDESVKKFRRLLADYEALTRQEDAAIAQGQCGQSLAEVLELKLAILPGWVEAGQQLDISPTSYPELHQALEAICRQEDEHRRQLDFLCASSRQRLLEITETRQRLQQLRRKCLEEEIPATAPAGFVAHG